MRAGYRFSAKILSDSHGRGAPELRNHSILLQIPFLMYVVILPFFSLYTYSRSIFELQYSSPIFDLCLRQSLGFVKNSGLDKNSGATLYTPIRLS